MTTHLNVHRTVADSWSSKSVSDIYEKIRPNYNFESVEFLLKKLGVLSEHSHSFLLVELGAGTGKFTRAALAVIENHSVKNVKIISTEPVKEMCLKFKEKVPNIEIHQRPASDLGLPSNSADAIIAAQCFHWFDNRESISEIHRVLKPGGIFGIIWNLPDRSVPWIKEIESSLDCKFDEIQINRPESKYSRVCVREHGGFEPEHRNDSYQFSIESDFAGVIERYKSYSVVASAEKNEKEAMLCKIKNIMKTHEDLKDKEIFNYDFVVKINWFQKISDKI